MVPLPSSSSNQRYRQLLRLYILKTVNSLIRRIPTLWHPLNLGVLQKILPGNNYALSVMKTVNTVRLIITVCAWHEDIT